MDGTRVLRVSRVRTGRLEARLHTPFRISTGQHDRLENFWVAVELHGGVTGWGEAAVAPHITGETPAQTRASLEWASRWLAGREVGDYGGICRDLRAHFRSNPAALSALEMAVLDAVARACGFPFWRFFGSRAHRLWTDVTIVLGSVREAGAAARRFHARGFRSFKIKIGGADESLDFERIEAVLRNAPGAGLLLDANQAFDVGRMLGFLGQLRRRGIRPQLLEQPVPRGDWDGLGRLTREGGVVVCADESVRTLADLAVAVKTRSVGAVNLKFAKSGLMEAAEMARFARAAGMKLMLGAMMESALAITAAGHFGAGFGGFDFVDLDTTYFLAGRLARSPYLDGRGCFDFRGAGEGIGVEVGRVQQSASLLGDPR
jgi:L-Ala-D/L-Glu epimerase